MLDKKVVMCDFKNIKSGMLVKIREDRNGLDALSGEVCMVLDRITVTRTLEEGSHEFYDPSLLILARGKRTVVSVDAVKEIIS